MMTRQILHIALHFIVPGVVARWVFTERWKRAWFIMVLTNMGLGSNLDHCLKEDVRGIFLYRQEY